MMLDAVTFDLGSARPPLFAIPDASGLAPLTLPDEFLRRQSHQPQAELPTDTVRRFETAMSAESKLPPSVVKSLMAHMSPGTPKVEGQKVESPKVKCPTIEDSEVESPKVKSPAVEGLKAESRKTEISSLVNPVPVASVEEPVVLAADAVIHADLKEIDLLPLSGEIGHHDKIQERKDKEDDAGIPAHDEGFRQGKLHAAHICMDLP